MVPMIYLLRISVILVLTLIAAGQARAAEPALDRLHEILAPFRGQDHPAPGPDFRCIGPRAMPAKQILRDWIETKLSAQGSKDLQTLVVEINAALRDADLMPKPSEVDPDPDDLPPECVDVGYLSDVKIEYEEGSEALIVRTGLVIDNCGVDDSAYVYLRDGKRLQRIWQFEEPIDPARKYEPQQIDAVHVSPFRDKPRPRLVLMLGQMTWCTSRYSGIYDGVWRIDAEGMQPKQLLRESPGAVRDRWPAIMGSVGTDDVLIDFLRPSFDLNVWSNEAIRHYGFDGAKLTRLDPIALGPRSFVHAWLDPDAGEDDSWMEDERWVDAAKHQQFQDWRKTHQKDGQFPGTYAGPSLHCRLDTTLWQVKLAQSDEDKPESYFIVRWTPPYRFKLIDIAAAPRKDCIDADADADAKRTLFPVQEWRN